MSSLPPEFPRVPIVVPPGLTPPGKILPVPIGSKITALRISAGALDMLSAAAEWSADDRLRGSGDAGAERAQLVLAMKRIALGRIVWAHLDPTAAAPFFDTGEECVRGHPSAGGRTTYLYFSRFLFTMEIVDGVAQLDTPG